MEKTTKKTIAVVSTAVILGGGALIYSTSTNSSDIDWSKYDLDIPSLNIPSIDVASIGLPSVEVGLDLPSLDELANLQLMQVNTNSSIPVVDTSKETNLNTVSIDSQTASINVNITQFKVTDEIMKALNLSQADIQYASINSPQINDPSNDIQDWIKFNEESKSLLKDKRYLDYDTNFNYGNENAKKWIQIYKQYVNLQDVNYIKINDKFKMITQVRTPLNSNELSILDKNLIYYKSEGYDSVLFAFDGTENVEDALNTVKYIISYHKMNVWFTYSGKQNLTSTVFINPDTYKKFLQKLAPYCKGFINSWRRTSVHLWQQDEVWKKYTNYILRNSNSNIYIVGQLYFGNTHKYQHHGDVGFGLNMFKNASACMIVNFGFKKIDMDYLFNDVLKKYVNNEPLIGCVVGQKPYYLTTYANHLDYKSNMKIKHEIENNFMNHGCIGTVTLSNDGHELETNNLSSTLFSTLNSK